MRADIGQARHRPVERREVLAPTSLGLRVSSGRFRVTGPAQRAGGPLARVRRGCLDAFGRVLRGVRRRVP